MGCLNLLNDKYKGKIIKMSDEKNKTKSKTKDKSINKKLKKIVTGILCAIIPVYLGWLGVEIVSIGKEVRENSTKIEQINNIEDRINGVDDKIDDINNGLNGKEGIYSRLSSVETIVNIFAINASADTQEYIGDVNVEGNNISSSKNPISADTCIGTDADGKVYIAKDLIGQTILLTYIEDGEEIYFLGQYNDNYHWEGYCVTNTYDAYGELSGICESNFSDGSRLDYESFYLSDAQNEWIYTDRDCKTDINEGISVRYKFDYSKNKNFTITNARVSDILLIEDVKNCDDKEMLSYYDGITSDELYNDDTGNAYLVKYNENGFVSVFYKGCFKDGYFNDDDAFEIVLDESNDINRYFLYEGKFSSGKRDSDAEIRYVTQEEIDTIMKENEFPNDLEWYSEE